MSSEDMDRFTDGSIVFERYRVEKGLGEGSYGKVKMAMDLDRNEKVALKIILKSSIKKQANVTRIKREVRLMRLLNHPNIARLYDVMETEKEIILCLQYVDGGELFDYIVAHTRLTEKVARRLFRQIVSAVDYCHESSIIHRDLKPENVLLDNNQQVKLIDFGFANLFDPEGVLKTFCGSPYYASPEMILGKQYVGPEVDVWSLGVILYALLAGYLPFRESNSVGLCKRIVDGDFTIPPHVSKDASSLIKYMLKVSPAERATLRDIRYHPWTCEGYSCPPDSHIPHRPKPEGSLDPATLEAMRLYGFDPDAVTEELLNGAQNGYHSGPSPALSVYCLFREQEAAGASFGRTSKSRRTRSVSHPNGYNSATSDSSVYNSSSFTARSIEAPNVSSSVSSSEVGRGRESNSVGSANSAEASSSRRSKSISGVVKIQNIPNPVSIQDDFDFTSDDDGQSSDSGTNDRNSSSSSKYLSVDNGGANRGRDAGNPQSRNRQSGGGGGADRGRRNSPSPDGNTIDGKMILSGRSQSLGRPISSVTQRKSREQKSLISLNVPQSGRVGSSINVDRSEIIIPSDMQSPSVESGRADTADNFSTKSRYSQTSVNRISVSEDQEKNEGHAGSPTSKMSLSKAISIVLSTLKNGGSGGGRGEGGVGGEKNKASGGGVGGSQSQPDSVSLTIQKRPSVLMSSVGREVDGDEPKQLKEIQTADNARSKSSKPLPSIIEEVERVLDENQCTVAWHGCLASCYSAGQQLQFTIEIYQVEGTKMYGLQWRRKKGSLWSYYNMCRTLLNQMKL